MKGWVGLVMARLAELFENVTGSSLLTELWVRECRTRVENIGNRVILLLVMVVGDDWLWCRCVSDAVTLKWHQRQTECQWTERRPVSTRVIPASSQPTPPTPCSMSALLCRISISRSACHADYVTVVEDRPIMSVKYCLPVPVVHFSPKTNAPCRTVSLQ